MPHALDALARNRFDLETCISETRRGRAGLSFNSECRALATLRTIPVEVSSIADNEVTAALDHIRGRIDELRGVLAIGDVELCCDSDSTTQANRQDERKKCSHRNLHRGRAIPTIQVH